MVRRSCFSSAGALSFCSWVALCGCGGRSEDLQGPSRFEAGSGGSGGASSATGGTNSGGLSGSGGRRFANVGLCGERGEGLVDEQGLFDVDAEFFVVSEEGVPDASPLPLICLVEFDTRLIGVGPAGCETIDGSACDWTYLFELANPRVPIDVDGACATHELRYDAAWLAEMTGARVAFGFALGYDGHGSRLMKYDFDTGSWRDHGEASWDEQSSEFVYQASFGFCGY